jgi:prepilin-type processing-associated H-X9-DG protein
LIAEIGAIGDYAINVVFTDGHARGIFPWTYLRELAFAADTQPVVQPFAHHGPSA